MLKYVKQIREYLGRERRHSFIKKCGYSIVRECFDGYHYYIDDGEEQLDNKVITSIFSVEYKGRIIDRPERVYSLLKKGIFPREPNLGFCPDKQRWYGYTNGRIKHFRIGDKVDSESHVCHPELPVGFEAKLMGDVKRMAKAFVKTVQHRI